MQAIKRSRAYVRPRSRALLLPFLPAVLLSALSACGPGGEPNASETGELTDKLVVGANGAAKGAAPAVNAATPAPPPNPSLRFFIDYGFWSTSGTMNHLAIHAALIPPRNSSTPAKILFFGGSQHEPQLTYGKNSWGLFNTVTPTPANPIQYFSLNQPDVFCSGHAHDASGNLVIVGGNEYYQVPNPDQYPPPPGGWVGVIPDGLAPVNLPGSGACTGINIHKCPGNHFAGLKTTRRWNRTSDTVTSGQNMPLGRWYPTLVRADDTYVPGNLLAFSGHPSASDNVHDNFDMDQYTGTGSAWVNQGYEPTNLYPRVHLTPIGLVVTHTQYGTTNVWTPFFSPPGPGFYTEDTLSSGPPDFYHDFHSSSVLLPLRPNTQGGYPGGRILMTNDVQPIILNLDNPGAGWQNTGPRVNPNYAGLAPQPRMHAVATILATGDVLVSGGIVNQGLDDTTANDTSNYYPEIWRDDLNAWHEVQGPLGNAQYSRNYHSVALLMPDGRVWTAGGNKRGGYAATGAPPGGGRELHWEIFEPWYISVSGGRPTISTSTAAPPSSGNWTITTGSGTTGTSITRVALIAPGSVTHSFDVDQRYVELKIASRTSTTVTAVVPSDRSVLPRGWYMLVISRANTAKPSVGPHIPSVSRWVQILP